MSEETLTKDEIVKALEGRRAALYTKLGALVAEYNATRSALGALGVTVEDPAPAGQKQEPDKIYGCAVGGRVKRRTLKKYDPEVFKSRFKHIGRGVFERVS